MTIKLDNSIRVWLPFPPSANNLFPNNRRTGKRYVSRQYQAWKKEAWLAIYEASILPVVERCDVLIELTAKDRRPRDADNYAKAIMDALVKNGVLIDDKSKHVRSVSAVWCEHDKDEAGALVIITKIRDQVAA